MFRMPRAIALAVPWLLPLASRPLLPMLWCAQALWTAPPSRSPPAPSASTLWCLWMPPIRLALTTFIRTAFIRGLPLGGLPARCAGMGPFPRPSPTSLLRATGSCGTLLMTVLTVASGLRPPLLKFRYRTLGPFLSWRLGTLLPRVPLRLSLFNADRSCRRGRLLCWLGLPLCRLQVMAPRPVPLYRGGGEGACPRPREPPRLVPWRCPPPGPSVCLCRLPTPLPPLLLPASLSGRASMKRSQALLRGFRAVVCGRTGLPQPFGPTPSLVSPTPCLASRFLPRPLLRPTACLPADVLALQPQPSARLQPVACLDAP